MCLSSFSRVREECLDAGISLYRVEGCLEVAAYDLRHGVEHFPDVSGGDVDAVVTELHKLATEATRLRVWVADACEATYELARSKGENGE